MLYHTDQKLKPPDKRRRLAKLLVITILLSLTTIFSCSCRLLTKSLDSNIGLSKQLYQLEDDIRNENWSNAKTSLEDSQRAWKKIKPIMQVDVDHDYVKEIEDGFVKLDGYLETKDKSNSLVSILLIQSTWENIDSL